MKIAFCVVKNIARGGGIEKYTLELGSRLVQLGHEVVVYSMRHYGDVPPQQEGMRIVPVHSLQLPCTEKITSSLDAAVRSTFCRGADIVHFHSVASGSFAWIPRLLAGRRCVLQFHGLEWMRSRWGSLGSFVLRQLEETSVRQSHAITAVSRTQCDFLRQRYGLPVTYIPTGAVVKDPPAAEEILKLGLEPGKYVLFASRLVSEKGAHFLIPAFRRLKTDCKLVIAGDVKGERAYKAHLRELAGGDERILFPGYVTGRLLEELFAHALVYVQPSQLEGLSIALLEAMSYGRCCLVSDIPENLEAVGPAGVSFRNGNVDDLSLALAGLLDDASTTLHLGHSLVERVRLEYDWNQIARDCERMYEQMIGGQLAAQSN